MTFDEAAEHALDYLASAVPLAWWSVTRPGAGGHAFVCADRVPGGGEFHLTDHVREAAVLADDPVDVRTYIVPESDAAGGLRSYLEVPVHEPDGALFGVICGRDPGGTGEDLAAHLPLLDLVGLLLSMVLAAGRERDEAARRATEAHLAVETDALTGIYNRRAWDRLITEEAAGYVRYADPTVVVSLDVDGMKTINERDGHWVGDRQLVATASHLREAALRSDVVARVGDDEFAMLLKRCTVEVAEIRIASLCRALEESGVPASLGWASARVDTGVAGARAEAEAELRRAKVSVDA